MMTYDTAAKIVAQHAPDMRLDASGGDHQPHVDVRLVNDGKPGKKHFSIMLPDTSHLMEGSTPEEIVAAELQLFIDALDIARKHL